MSSVHIHCVEVDGVVLGVKRILAVRTVVRIVIDAAQHPYVSAGYRGTGSRTYATECQQEWSTPCTRRIASDT